MAIFRQLTLGFGAGAFGAVIFALVAILLNAIKIQEMLGLPPPPLPESYWPLFYARVAVGGAWGLLFALPVLNRAWWLKGIIIGALWTLYLYVTAEGGMSSGRLGLVLFLNTIWGIAAGAWWAFVSGPRKNGRKFGTFMR